MKRVLFFALGIAIVGYSMAQYRHTGRQIVEVGNTDYYNADRTPYATSGGQCGYISPLATAADRVQCRDEQIGFKNAQFPLWACD